MQTTILLVGIALFIVAAYSDVKSFRIPNMLVAAVALLGVTRLIAVGDPTAAVYTAGASVTLLAIGFVLFWQGIVGGGDAKLIASAALLVGYHNLFSLLVLMGICGAVVSVAVLVMRSYLPLWLGPSLAIRLSKVRSVPYGVAIAAGGITTLLSQSSLPSFFG